MLQTLKKIFPEAILNVFLPPYHYALAFFAACRYRFPSRDLTVIAVTGTKGKSTTVELLNAILEEAGYKTAL
ncbi:MAG TPA: UDP-N-acetylmuramoyl-L-alanyl-D-glutamate--2,6-diaminopimelate ligase, partial [Candidatus Paceibacterota bacterium]